MKSLLQAPLYALILLSSLQATTEQTQMLNLIASTEKENWDQTIKILQNQYSDLLSEPSISKSLDHLAATIVSQGDPTTIHLLQRALKNYNEFEKEKTSPLTTFYKHYQSPPFRIPEIDLVLNVETDRVFVTTTLKIERVAKEKTLVLDGVDHTVHSVTLNGTLLNREAYRVTPNELILLKVPQADTFTLKIESEIDPFHNTALEGLYASQSALITQCESEGARRIFYTLDRPDVLSKITTTIIASLATYPVRLSNGNLIEESSLPNGKVKITWQDPIPKPSYLFACILGNFGKVEDHYLTKSGRKVRLATYVEPGKEARATYSLKALKEAMRFDETFFDREYDLNDLKMVAAADFNAGAMENKGLMVFNDRALLVDQHSGTDGNFLRVASIIAHEYFHNWSGNRVTVRNWFELALKEAFTDFRTILFEEWLFGSALMRPQQVTRLREGQFPEESSEGAHPIMVESFISPQTIYDDTTYVKGREVFRTLQTYLDLLIPEGFRKTQNLYFSRYDGQAVTFRELLKAADDVLAPQIVNTMAQFERWFTQQGTPQIKPEIVYDPNKNEQTLHITQSNIHPKTKEEQKPLLIPFSYELLKQDGTPLLPKQSVILSDRTQTYSLPTNEPVIPIFMHNYSAPVMLDYAYSLDELALLMKQATDPFVQWEAGQKYTLALLQQEKAELEQYLEALKEETLPLIAKARLLRTPSLRAMAQEYNDYDYAALQEKKEHFEEALANKTKPELEKIIQTYREPSSYAPTPAQIEVRELRASSLNLLVKVDPAYAEKAYRDYLSATNFSTSLSLFKILIDHPTFGPKASHHFYEKWKKDRMVFNHWLSVEASASTVTPARLKELMSDPHFDQKNPNHISSVLGPFINGARYHDRNGEGYAFIVDQILEIQRFNPQLAFTRLTSNAFIDLEKLPSSQQKLMVREMKRLLVSETPPEAYDLIEKTIHLIQE